MLGYAWDNLRMEMLEVRVLGNAGRWRGAWK